MNNEGDGALALSPFLFLSESGFTGLMDFQDWAVAIVDNYSFIVSI